MSKQEILLVGRSSSHFTRIARIFAIELGMPHTFRAVLDLNTLDRAAYADNPALKIPVMVDEQGPLFGTENICRALAKRSGKNDSVVLRGDVSDRLVANAEEVILHAMNSEVIIISTGMTGDDRSPPPKVRPSLENSLAYLDKNLERVLAALPPARVVSFCEIALFCLVEHLPFRKIMDVSAYPNLTNFARAFAERRAAQATAYRFDAA